MLEILFQDESLVAVNKPPGLLVHRSDIDRRETQFAMNILRDQINQPVFTVHRLDRATSGVLLFALNKTSAQKLNQMFSNEEVKKTYLAVVRGYAPHHQVIDYPLKEQLDRIADRMADPNKPAQLAVTEIKSLAEVELPFQVDKFLTSRYSLVLAQPRTGRKHQIRRHLRHLGNPIIGDITHGVGKHNRFFESHFKIRRLLLACTEISFNHPEKNNLLSIRAPLEESFKNTVIQLGWSTALKPLAT